MRGLAIGDISAAARVPGYAAPFAVASGAARSATFAPEGLGLWALSAELEIGTTIEWSERHGDEAVYVLSGSLEFADRRCPAGGVVIVEAGAAAVVRALEPTTVLHLGPDDVQQPAEGIYGPAAADGHRIHVIGPKGCHATVTDARDTHFYADSTCETCRITLFYTGRTGLYVTGPHSHSESEILYVLHDSIFLGRREIPAGSALAVWADRRYAFRGAPEGFGILNYRRDVSRFSSPNTEVPFIEGGRATGMAEVGDVIY